MAQTESQSKQLNSFTKFVPDYSAWRRGGSFVRVYNSRKLPDIYRQVYIAADCYEWLGEPKFVEFHLDYEDRLVAIVPSTRAATGSYAVHGRAVPIELPLRALNVSNVTDDRIEPELDSDRGWIIIDFLGGAPRFEG